VSPAAGGFQEFDINTNVTIQVVERRIGAAEVRHGTGDVFILGGSRRRGCELIKKVDELSGTGRGG
jgi:hypothetical protein